MEILYIIGFIVFLFLAQTVKKTNEVLSKIFMSVGFVAVLLTCTNLGNRLAIATNNPAISKICLLIAILFFIFLLTKFLLNSIKLFVILVVIFGILLATTDLGAYFNIKNFTDNITHGAEQIDFIDKFKKTVN